MKPIVESSSVLARGSVPAQAAARTARFSLPVPADARLSLARGWLMLALASLLGSGVFSVLLVLSRTPYLKDAFPVADFFHVALVVHVDLSVLVWFLSLAGVLWTLNSTTRARRLGWIALAVAVAGAITMSISPFVRPGEPIMSNYVPVLDGAGFLVGLGVFAAGVGLLVARSLFAVPAVGLALDGTGALRFGLNAAAVSTAVALIAFVWSLATVPADLAGKAYYELAFWGGGHALQFTYTLLMLVAWVWLASASGLALALSPRVVLMLFGLALASVFATPVVYLAHDVTSVEHRNLLTALMRVGGGLAILPLELAIVIALVRESSGAGAAAPLRAALAWSAVLFAVGGVIGFLIHGSNVRIPAHYHGCIVGVTLALMGLAYHLMPVFGYAEVGGRLARWQPAVYGVGQLLHIIGLVWSGGYGVQRKVGGAAQVLSSPQEVAGMALMGLGGLVAVVGGLLFVVVIGRSMREGPAPRRDTA